MPVERISQLERNMTVENFKYTHSGRLSVQVLHSGSGLILTLLAAKLKRRIFPMVVFTLSDAVNMYFLIIFIATCK